MFFGIFLFLKIHTNHCALACSKYINLLYDHMFHICFVGTTNKISSKLYKHVVQHSIESTIITINYKVDYVLASKVEESGTFDVKWALKFLVEHYVEGESTLRWYIPTKKMYYFLGTFCIILGENVIYFI